MTRRGVVFLGPTLPGDEARAVLAGEEGWEVRPPARMGDLYALLDPSLAAVVLVDGVFHGQPAIWHRELLAALDGGVPVWGASSMGALRAAELAPHGMVGVGTVFGWYRDGVLDADDEVALLHGPEEVGWAPLSTPLVNTRATVAAAVGSGALDPDDGAALVAAARRLHFPRRTREGMAEALTGTGWGPERVAAALDALDAHPVDVKRDDAVEALRRVRGALSREAPAAPAPPADPPARWRRDRLLRATLDGIPGEERARALAADAGLRRRVVLEALALLGGEGGAPAPRAGDAAPPLPPGADLAAAGALPGEARALWARRRRLEALAARPGGLEGAAAAWARRRRATAPGGPADGHLDLEAVLGTDPEALGLPWAWDVALLDAWRADRLFGAPPWGGPSPRADSREARP